MFSMKQGPPPGHCRVTGVGGGGGFMDSVQHETRPTSRSLLCYRGWGGGGGLGGGDVYGQCSA